MSYFWIPDDGNYKQLTLSKCYCLSFATPGLEFHLGARRKQCPCSSCSSAWLSYLQTHHQLYDLWKVPNKSECISLTTTMDLHRKITMQSSVPSWIRIALMATSSILLLPSPMPIPPITVVLNLMMSLGTTSMPHQWCWTQDLPFPEAWRPRTSPLWADMIVAWFSVEWKKLKKLLSEFQCLVFFWVPRARCAQGETREQVIQYLSSGPVWQKFLFGSNLVVGKSTLASMKKNVGPLSI